MPVRRRRTPEELVTQPAFVVPMAPRLVASLPGPEGWLYEVKWDGFRTIAIKDRGKVQLVSRNEKDLGDRFPNVVGQVTGVGAETAVIDGELVAIDARGRPSFQLLSQRRAGGRPVVYYAFDL